MLFPHLNDYVNGGLDKQAIADNADHVLNQPAFKIALDSLQEGILNKIIFSKPDETILRERLKLMFDLTIEIKAELKHLIDEVKVANEKEKLAKENEYGTIDTADSSGDYK